MFFVLFPSGESPPTLPAGDAAFRLGDIGVAKPLPPSFKQQAQALFSLVGAAYCRPHVFC